MICGKSYYMWVFKKYSYYDIFLIIIFKLFFKFNKIKNESNEKRR